jgi:hypothetical protein
VASTTEAHASTRTAQGRRHRGSRGAVEELVRPDWGDEYIIPRGWPCFYSKIKIPSGVLLKGQGAYSRAVKAYTPSDPYEIFFELSNSAAVTDVHLFGADGTSGGVGIGMVSSPEQDLSSTRVRNTKVTIQNTGKWCGGFIYDGTNGPLYYGQRDNIVETALITSVLASRLLVRIPRGSRTLTRSTRVGTRCRPRGSRTSG